MTAVQFRNTDVRLSETLRATGLAIDGDRVTLRRLLEIVGEQGLLVFCAILGMPFSSTEPRRVGVRQRPPRHYDASTAPSRR